MPRYVTVRWDEIRNTYEQGSTERRYFLDIETGEILPIFVDLIERGGNKEDARRIAGGVNTRYFLIPHKPSSEGYAEMEEFIDTVKQKRLKNQLVEAIEGKGAFRRFRDILALDPIEEERWLRMRDERIRKEIESWLRANDIVLQDES